jgi:hypothetical protein
MTTSIFWRSVWFIIVAGLWYSGFWFIAGVATIAYSFWYTGYELIVLAGMIDVQYMTGIWPWYTVGAVGLFCVVEWVKPRLMAYSI